MSVLEWIISVIGMLGGIAGIVSAYIGYRQWLKVNKKIVMIEHAGQATEVLPAWYVSRMMTDHWLFGLALDDGRMVAIKKIKSLSDDGQWMDVELAELDEIPQDTPDRNNFIYAVANDRTEASIQVSKITVAIDLWAS